MKYAVVIFYNAQLIDAVDADYDDGCDKQWTQKSEFMNPAFLPR